MVSKCSNLIYNKCESEYPITPFAIYSCNLISFLNSNLQKYIQSANIYARLAPYREKLLYEDGSRLSFPEARSCFRKDVINSWLSCNILYAFSFLQMLLPVSAVLKGILWVVFYGLAKACQYTSLIILGKSGFSMLRAYFARKVK